MILLMLHIVYAQRTDLEIIVHMTPYMMVPDLRGDNCFPVGDYIQPRTILFENSLGRLPGLFGLSLGIWQVYAQSHV